MRPGRAANEAQTVRQGREDGGSGARRRKQRPKERSQLTHDSGRDQFIFGVDFPPKRNKGDLKIKANFFKQSLNHNLADFIFWCVFNGSELIRICGLGLNGWSEFVG